MQEHLSLWSQGMPPSCFYSIYYGDMIKFLATWLNLISSPLFPLQRSEMWLEVAMLKYVFGLSAVASSSPEAI